MRPHLRSGADWLAVDTARAVALRPAAPPGSGERVDIGATLAVWRRRIGRSRRVVAARRAVTAALVALVPFELAEAAFGVSRQTRLASLGIGAAVCAAIAFVQARRSVTIDDTALLLDRDLRLADSVTTALELSRGGRAAASVSPRFLELAHLDARRALAGTLAAYRARAASGAVEWLAPAAAALLVVAALAVPARSGSGGAAGRAAGGPRAAARAPLPALRGFSSPPTARAARPSPRLNAVAPGSGHPGTLSGHSPYGGGVASRHAAADVAPARPLPSTKTARSGGVAHPTPGAAEARGSTGSTQGDQNGGAAAGRRAGGGSVRSLAPTAAGTTGAAGPAKAGSAGGRAPGGGGAAGTGAAKAGADRGISGGASAGGTHGRVSAAPALVPQLGFGLRLPIVAGFESTRDTGARAAATNAPGGGGGGTRSANATGGGGAGGLTYVPPGVGATTAAERGLLLAYFSGAGGRTPSRW